MDKTLIRSRTLAIPGESSCLQHLIIIEWGHAESVPEIGRRSLCFQILTPSVKMA